MTSREWREKQELRHYREEARRELNAFLLGEPYEYRPFDPERDCAIQPGQVIHVPLSAAVQMTLLEIQSGRQYEREVAAAWTECMVTGNTFARLQR